jgi:hypothetical protein
MLRSCIDRWFATSHLHSKNSELRTRNEMALKAKVLWTAVHPQKALGGSSGFDPLHLALFVWQRVPTRSGKKPSLPPSLPALVDGVVDLTLTELAR